MSEWQTTSPRWLITWLTDACEPFRETRRLPLQSRESSPLALLIVSWCAYHRVEAHAYFVNAIPLPWAGKYGSGDWATRGMLVFFLILIAAQFGKTIHNIWWWIIKLALIVGLIGYIYLIYNLGVISAASAHSCVL